MENNYPLKKIYCIISDIDLRTWKILKRITTLLLLSIYLGWLVDWLVGFMAYQSL